MRQLLNSRNKRVTLLVLVLMISILAIIVSFHPRPKTQFVEPDITLYLSAMDKTVQMSLENYIIGTVAAEMPASFGIEALKAQAVCARTYAVRKITEERGYPKGAQLSDDITTCQAYISKDEFQNRNPTTYQELWDKISCAVKETRGEIMLYEGEPIDALYHSTCGGRTESSEAVGADIPYLQSVPCDYCQNSSYYRTKQELSAQEIKNQLSVTGPIQIKITQRTPSGRVSRLDINGSTFYAETIRRTFKLPSTWWTFHQENGALIIDSRGYGHGLGLCQFGAGGMAASGYNYLKILQHYYQGIELLRLDY